MAFLYKVHLVTSVLGQECLNRFWYYDVNEATDAQTVAWAVGVTLAPAIAGIMTDDTEFKEVRAEEVIKQGDKAVVPFASGTTGVYGDQTAGSHDALAWSLQAASANFRQGRKAFAGVHSPGIHDGVPGATYQAQFGAVSSALRATISIAGDIIVPVLAREISAGAAYVISQIILAAWKRYSTQNSRKGYTNPGSGLKASAPYYYEIDYTVTPTSVDSYGVVTPGSWSGVSSPFGMILTSVAIPPAVDYEYAQLTVQL